MSGDGKIAENHLDKVAHFLLFAFLAINILYKYENSSELIDYLLFSVLQQNLRNNLSQVVT